MRPAIERALAHALQELLRRRWDARKKCLGGEPKFAPTGGLAMQVVVGDTLLAFAVRAPPPDAANSFGFSDRTLSIFHASSRYAHDSLQRWQPRGVAPYFVLQTLRSSPGPTGLTGISGPPAGHADGDPVGGTSA